MTLNDYIAAMNAELDGEESDDEVTATVITSEYKLTEVNEYGNGVEVVLAPIEGTDYIDLTVNHIMSDNVNEGNSSGVTITVDAAERLIQHLQSAIREARGF